LIVGVLTAAIGFLPLDYRLFVPQIQAFVPAITAVIALVVAYYVVRQAWTGNIRARLISSFLALVIIPLVISGVIASLVIRQAALTDVYEHLSSSAALKEDSVTTWVGTMKETLELVYQEREATEVVQALLDVQSLPAEEPADSEGSGERDPEDVLVTTKADLEDVVARTDVFEEIFVLDLEGQVVVSTDDNQVGKFFSDEPFFQEGLQGEFVQPPQYSQSLDRFTVVASKPLVNAQENQGGVLAGRADLDSLNEIMLADIGLGETGETYLVRPNNVLLTPSRFEGYQAGDTYVRTEGVETAFSEQQNGTATYEGYRGEEVIGAYRWLPNLELALIAEVGEDEALRTAFTATITNLGVAAGAAVVAVLVALFVTRTITSPLFMLVGAAEQIVAGDLDVIVEVDRKDEIGTLADTFNNMAARLREILGTLEQRVAERTRDLEQRSTYLEGAAEISRAASSILETDTLIRRVVRLIKERFDLYYVGLFLVDERNEWAVLQAGTGAAGRKMLAREHRIRIGEGMIGWSIDNAEARIALDVGEDAVRFENPDLPETRSEAALPLRSRGRVLGALTVQSNEAAAFDQDVITTLQTMADQVAVALDNAELFAQREAALEAERRAYGELSYEAWKQLSRGAVPRYRSDAPDVAYPVTEGTPQAERAQDIQQDQQNDGSAIVPIKIYGKTVGGIKISTTDSSALTQEQLTLVQNVSEQLSTTLESARLYEETQRRAAREQLTSEIAAHMRETLDVDAVMKTAVREIHEALELYDIAVELESPEGSEETV
jgi:GAF domain-containing protein